VTWGNPFLRGLIAGFILASLLIALTGHAGIQSLHKPMVRMQLVMGMRLAKHPPALHWYQQVRHGYLNPPHRRQWLCIHHFEGSWRDPNPPYFGGLQMDYGFQRTYNPYLLRLKGTADHWQPVEQMWAAERAFRSGRGFRPWPRTARFCGLI
jgi:hypothetical protein